MHKNSPFLPPLINEIHANIQIIHQILVLGIPQRHRHPLQLEVDSRPLQRVEQRLRRQRALAAIIDLAGVDLPDPLGGDVEPGLPVAEEGDGGRAEEGEDVGDAGGVRRRGQGLGGVGDVTEEEALAD